MAFERIAHHAIPSIQSEWTEWRDSQTGLRHFHLHRDDVEMACLIAVPTRPTSDNGAPHILEHLSLCANRRFPMRNAFFGMLQRSMASFMNAMTDTDITYYPFATPNEKDFFHLLEVYANAVFFPRLERLDFLQEGWRHTLDEKGNLGIDGVVFNEMKGALATADRLYQQRITAALYPGTARVHLAGGDPLAIPDITHEELVAFHAEHYHPSRAVVVTYGKVDPLQVQERLNAWVLSQEWTRLPPLAPQFSQLAAPVRLETPIGIQQNPESEHRVAKSWIIEGATDPVSRLEAAVMNELLFSEGGAISTAIDDAGFGRQGVLTIDVDGVDIEAEVGMDGLTEAQTVQAEKLITDTIDRVAREGVPSSQISAVLRQVEIAQRQIAGGHGLPFGVSLSLEAAAGVLRGRDPLLSIDRSSALTALRERLKTPEDAAGWVRRHLRDNPRRVDTHGRPDPLFFERRQEALDKRLADNARALTDERRQAILADMAALANRQDTKTSRDVLPFIQPQDVPVEPTPLPAVMWANEGKAPQALLHTPSNGLLRLGVTLDASHLSPNELFWAGTASELLLQVGLGAMGWEQAGRWRKEKAGSMETGVALIQPVGHPDSLLVQVNLDALSLERDAEDASEALARTWQEARMDESERIVHLLISHIDTIVQQAGTAGNTLAGFRSLAHTRPAEALNDRVNGGDALRLWMELRARLAADGGGDVLENLQIALEQLQTAPFVVRGEGERPAVAAARLAARLPANGEGRLLQATRLTLPEPAQQAFVADTAVNYVWQSFNAPESGHPDAAAAAILAKMLSQEVLHPSIREKGGAYGGGLRYQSGALSFFSYRDPRLAGTLDDFQRAIDWASSGRLSEKGLNEAILSVLRDADPPGSPHALAKRAWRRACQGWTREQQARYREQVRGTTRDDVVRMAQTWLAGSPSSRVAFTHPGRSQEAERCGLAVEPLFPAQAPAAARRNSPA